MTAAPSLSADALAPRGRHALWALTEGHRRRISVLGVVTLVGALIEAGFLVLLTAALLSLANGSASVGPALGVRLPVGTALGLGAIAVTVRLVLSVAGVRMSAVLTSEVSMARRRRLARAFLRANWATQQAEPSGRLQELLTSFVARVTMAVLSITQALTALLSLMAFLGTGVLVEPLATLAMLAALTVLALVLAPVRRRIRSRAGDWARMNLQFANTVSELSALGQEMQTFGVRDRVIDRVDALTTRNAEEQRVVQTLNGVLTPLYTFLAYIAVIGGLVALSRTGVGDVAAVGAVMLLLLRSLSYGQQLLAVSGQLTTSIPFIEGLDDTVARYESEAGPSGTCTPQRAAPLEVDHVTFAYTSGRAQALTDVSVRIGVGETVGVIGPSGSGKSTLAQLVLGLREPTSGSVRVDGLDLRTVDRDWWTQHVSFVPQNALLLTGTVAENIRFFRDGISDEVLSDAARRANILVDVEQLPEGFDTHLGERGGSLSGGQRQRLSIARALAGHPDLLVLDEPTSALDGHSERLIRDTLASLHGDVAMVVIAHRMSTLDLCDRIIVVEHGRITADDHPQALRERSGFYRRALSVAGID